MTLASAVARILYVGNNSTNEYSVPFRFRSESHLRVVQYDDEGTKSVLVLGVDYSVEGVNSSSGGTITLLDGNLPTGYTLLIRRVRPVTQGTAIKNQGAYFPDRHEDAFDDMVMIDQQQQDDLARAVRVAEGEDSSSLDLELPLGFEDAAGRMLRVNDDGDGLDFGPTSDDLEGANTSATAAAASAAAAATSETNAAASETAADASATAAAASATAAAGSATAAATSASAASTSATAAASSATSAASSASDASDSADDAASSETNAASSATAAATSATSAATSATNAATSATNAATSATAASSSASSAAADAASALYRWGGTVGGTADAITLTPSPALSAYAVGIRFAFIATGSNTGAATVDISGLGAKSIKTQDGSNPSAGFIASGNLYTLTYDGTNFRVLETGTPGDGAVTTSKLADGLLTADATGRAKMADGYTNANKLASDAVTTAKIIDGALSADATGRAKMADSFITTAKLNDGVLSADSTGRAKMADSFVTTGKLNDGLLTADSTGRAKMADSFVNAAKLASDAVTTVKILDANVTTAKIAAANVTAAKLGSGKYGGKYIKAVDSKAASTDGGGATSGSWFTRTLNTLVTDNTGSASLSSNELTIPAGTYYFVATAPAYRTNGHVVRLYNVTDAAVIETGNNACSDGDQDTMERSTVTGQFTIAASKAIRVEHRVTTTRATDGQGFSQGFAANVYATLELWQVAE